MFVSRRAFLTLVPPAALQVTQLSASEAGATKPPDAMAPPPSDTFPTQEPTLVREMVGVSHGNVPRVKELLAAHASLANAAWDWGFGDWETALGAASHVGNHEIAALLLDHGARPSIFSAAMLGQLDVVRAFVVATPGVQRTLGPHGITLLAHAKAGGDGAKPVYAYLEQLGDANTGYSAAFAEDRAPRYTGTYVYGTADSQRIEVSYDRGALWFERAGAARRGLIPVEPDAFHPVGAPRVRIRFVAEGDRVTALAVHDPDVVVRAVRRA
jgi:hypothetical protein